MFYLTDILQLIVSIKRKGYASAKEVNFPFGAYPDVVSTGRMVFLGHVLQQYSI